MTNDRTKNTECFSIKYEVKSGPGTNTAAKCVLRIVANLIIGNRTGTASRKIGQITGYKLLLNAASKAGLKNSTVFRVDKSLQEVGKVVLDQAGEDFSKTLTAAYGERPVNPDVLLLSGVELLPKYRKTSIAGTAIKEVYKLFSGGCGFVLLKCLPVQFEQQASPTADKWKNRMQPEALEQNRDEAQYALRSYFIKKGFDYLPHVSDEYLFVSTREEDRKRTKSKFK